MLLFGTWRIFGEGLSSVGGVYCFNDRNGYDGWLRCFHFLCVLESTAVTSAGLSSHMSVHSFEEVIGWC